VAAAACVAAARRSAFKNTREKRAAAAMAYNPELRPRVRRKDPEGQWPTQAPLQRAGNDYSSQRQSPMREMDDTPRRRFDSDASSVSVAFYDADTRTEELILDHRKSRKLRL
jgi:hypothetical protein